MSAASLLLDHLGTAVTSVCRAWSVTRSDGVVFGFTDHDQDLSFEGVDYLASSGLTARALQQTTGFSVDNSEALGALSAASVTEADIFAGRFDSAEVRAWLVNWADPNQRIEQFRGSIGEVVRSGGKFSAELRGLTDRLNQPRGRVYQRGCSAVLGDQNCRFDLAAPGYRIETEVIGLDPLGRMLFGAGAELADRWFERGRLEMLTGAAHGLTGMIKSDRLAEGGRAIELWNSFGATVALGDMGRLVAGCDRQPKTCQTKFSNFSNFRGFPHIPGEDWLASYPTSTRDNDGGSLQR